MLMCKLVMKMILILQYVSLLTFAQSDSSLVVQKNEIAGINQKVERLQSELDTLKNLVNELRSMQANIHESDSVEGLSSQKSEKPGVRTNNQFWLSAGGIRHNASCRFYGSKKGKICTPNMGKPCKKCGG